MIRVDVEVGLVADRPETVTCEECGGPVPVAPRGALPKRHAPGKCVIPDPAPEPTEPDPALEPTERKVQIAPYMYELYSDGQLVGQFEGFAG
jgi:hypothetical protein